MQLSPAILKELSEVGSRPVGRRHRCLLGAEAPCPAVGPKPPNVHPSSTRPVEKPTSWQARISRLSPQTGAQGLALGPRLPANASAITGKQSAASSRQLGPPEGEVTYAAVLAGPVAPIQPSGSLTPTATGSDLSEPPVSCETAHRRMSGPLTSRMAPLHTPR